MIKKIGLAVVGLLAIVAVKSYAVSNGTNRYLNAYTSPGQTYVMKVKTVNVLDTTSTEILASDNTRIDWWIENVGYASVYVATGTVADASTFSYELGQSTNVKVAAGAAYKPTTISSEWMNLKYVGAIYGISASTGVGCAECYVPVKVVEICTE